MALAVIRFDMRRSEDSPGTDRDRYATALEMAAYADQEGFDLLVLSEHHGDEGAYLPSPLVFGAAIAARTERIMITVSALLVPLHDPIRLAEDLAVLDLISGGRVSFVAGIGYRPGEYHLLQKDWNRRGSILEEDLEVMLQAWSGEPFEYLGETVQVLPRPVQRPHPTVYIGGSSEISARRAARLGLGLFPAVGDDHLEEVYREECERLGREPGQVVLPSGPAAVLVSEDPDRTWAEVGDLLLDDATAYAAHLRSDMRSHAASGARTVDELRAEGVYRVLTPEECVELARGLGPFGGLVFHPLCGGTPAEIGWESLHLVKEKVLPHLHGT